MNSSSEKQTNSKGWIVGAAVGAGALAILILAIILFTGRVPIDYVPEDPPGPVDGEAVYARSCQVCHGRDGRGTPGRNPPLTDEAWLRGEVPVLVVLHGLQGPLTIDGVNYSAVMPPMGHILSNAEIAAVLTYVGTSFGNELGEVTREEVAKVREAHDPNRGLWHTEELDVK